jgi:hypothetical protein
MVDGAPEARLWSALTPEHELIGRFPDRKSATYVILIHPRRATTRLMP